MLGLRRELPAFGRRKPWRRLCCVHGQSSVSRQARVKLPDRCMQHMAASLRPHLRPEGARLADLIQHITALDG